MSDRCSLTRLFVLTRLLSLLGHKLLLERIQIVIDSIELNLTVLDHLIITFLKLIVV